MSVPSRKRSRSLEGPHAAAAAAAGPSVTKRARKRSSSIGSSSRRHSHRRRSNSAARHTLETVMEGYEDSSDADSFCDDGTCVRRGEKSFKPPPEWALLSKTPCMAPQDDADTTALMQRFIHAQLNVKRFEERMSGQLKPLQEAATHARREFARALATECIARAKRDGGKAFKSRCLGAYFALPSSTFGARDIKYSPLAKQKYLVVVFKERSRDEMVEDPVRHVLRSITRAEVVTKENALLKKMSKTKRATTPRSKSLAAAFATIFKQKLSAKLVHKEWDIEFLSALPKTVARATAGMASLQPIPEALTGMWDVFVAAETLHKKRATRKAKAIAPLKKELAAVEGPVMKHMLRTRQASQFYAPMVNNVAKPMYVRVRVAKPKYAKPTATALHKELPSFLDRAGGVKRLWSDDGESLRPGAVDGIVRSFTQWRKEVCAKEVTPSKLYVTLNLAKGTKSSGLLSTPM